MNLLLIFQKPKVCKRFKETFLAPIEASYHVARKAGKWIAETKQAIRFNTSPEVSGFAQCDKNRIAKTFALITLAKIVKLIKKDGIYL